jgi:hypothetical protein
MLSVAALGSLANTAEVTSTNLRSGATFDNLKASWGQALSVGDFTTNVQANYDYNANKDFVKDISFSGDLVEDGDMTVSYEVTHDFGDSNTNVKLTAVSSGTTVGAEYDQNEGVTEISAERDVDLGDQTVNVQPSWIVKSKTARVKLMSKLGDSDSVNAQIDYETDGGATAYEVGYDRNLEDGRDVSATFSPDSKNLEVEYTDTTFESGATWTATAAIPLESGDNILDSASLKLKRSWSW